MCEGRSKPILLVRCGGGLPKPRCRGGELDQCQLSFELGLFS